MEGKEEDVHTEKEKERVFMSSPLVPMKHDKKKPFAGLYVHTGVQRCEKFPGISAVRSIYDAIPINVKRNLEAVYFLHPGLQARLFLATFGRFLFTGGCMGS